eukprot:TRINITY_DN3276_c0_g1_i2.p1 TRINITY_DN3276_c0_g1~~TRINITY_DN3276_c0_g1_i2.p1  ORF type:complete len:205 (+),score=70.05 TRINITY_DN3276_c0_g1_i2:155-769(+)
MDSLKLTSVVLVASVLMKTSLAATAIGLSAINKDLANQCIDEETKSAYRLHSSWPMGQGQCGVKTCIKFSNSLYIQYETCGQVDGVGSGCKIVENLSAVYPECCPRVVCDAEPQPPTQKLPELPSQQAPVFSDNGINNEINIDEYGQYDENDQLFMMSSYDAPAFYEDYFLSGDEITEQQHPNENHEPMEYMVDWDTLFANYNN